jgi:potassium inwardly-rectifying channel subfamily J
MISAADGPILSTLSDKIGPASATKRRAALSHRQWYSYILRNRSSSGLIIRSDIRKVVIVKKPMKRILPRRSHHFDISSTGDVGRSSWFTDPFHRLIEIHTGLLCLFFMLTYLVLWFSFALLYLAISEDCGLETSSYRRALIFSVSTQSTIGYGVPDLSFDGCWAALPVIMIQTLVGSLVNAALVGTLFVKFARPKPRASRISFSEKATIRKIRGSFYFMFQMVDTNTRSQIIDTHVRCYTVRSDVRVIGASKPVNYQQCFMRLTRPDDQMNSLLFLALPTLVVHRIDAWSPLHPSPEREAFSVPSDPMSGYSFPDLPLRQGDAEGGMRTGVSCEYCGESFGTKSHLSCHLGVCPHSTRDDSPDRQYQDESVEKEPADELDELLKHLETSDVEVLCILEGIESTTGCNLQARKSYSFRNGEILINRTFVPCVGESRRRGGGCAIDMALFHATEAAPSDSRWFGAAVAHA